LRYLWSLTADEIAQTAEFFTWHERSDADLSGMAVMTQQVPAAYQDQELFQQTLCLDRQSGVGRF
jgi:hypothetical protein